MKDVILDTLIDSLKLLPFLFVTYLIMEYVEHKAGDKFEKALHKAGRVGPLFGGVIGVVPQCGFSAAASGLYTGRIITTGTLRWTPLKPAKIQRLRPSSPAIRQGRHENQRTDKRVESRLVRRLDSGSSPLTSTKNRL